MANPTATTRTFMKPPPEKKEPKPPRRKLPRPRARLSMVLIVLLLAFSIFMVFQYRAAKQKVQTGAPAAASKQVKAVITNVGKLIILPKDETPTVATVVHADKLKSQSFFKNARDGDKVLVYNQAKQAYLYRPSTNQLVNVAPVTVSPSSSNNLGQ